MVRAKRESDIRRSGRLVGAGETSKKLAEWRRPQQKNLSILGLLKKRVASVPQREQLERVVPQGEKKLVLLSFEEERIGGA